MLGASLASFTMSAKYAMYNKKSIDCGQMVIVVTDGFLRCMHEENKGGYM